MSELNRHLIIVAVEALEAKMSSPPTTAQQNLHDALHAADEWSHENEENTTVIEQIDAEATAIAGYCNAFNPPASPQDNRLQSYADALNGLIS